MLYRSHQQFLCLHACPCAFAHAYLLHLLMSLRVLACSLSTGARDQEAEAEGPECVSLHRQQHRGRHRAGRDYRVGRQRGGGRHPPGGHFVACDNHLPDPDLVILQIAEAATSHFHIWCFCRGLQQPCVGSRSRPAAECRNCHLSGPDFVTLQGASIAICQLQVYLPCRVSRQPPASSTSGHRAECRDGHLSGPDVVTLQSTCSTAKR